MTASRALTIGVLTEDDPREHRVALDPGAVGRLTSAGRRVLVESGCGDEATFPDVAYTLAGAEIATRTDVLGSSDVLAVVRFPGEAAAASLRSGQVLLGLLEPMRTFAEISRLAERGVTVIAFELLPRTLSRAQAMDALSSQASAAGYRAAIVAADAFGRYLPMMVTAAGASAPARVVVVGAGVAGLQAIATAKRLGAVVTGYDVREASRGEVESLGARFLTSTISSGAGTGGYARVLTADEQKSQQDELSSTLTRFDIIITTAQVPGRVPPVLVTAATLAALAPGSVCVDLGASDRGGNIVGSIDGRTVTTDRGVSVIGAGALAADLPTSASQMYARNVSAVIDSIAPGHSVVLDPADEVHRSIVAAHGGVVTAEILRTALALPAITPLASTPKEAAA